jgi:hypothetical protein
MEPTKVRTTAFALSPEFDLGVRYRLESQWAPPTVTPVDERSFTRLLSPTRVAQTPPHRSPSPSAATSARPPRNLLLLGGVRRPPRDPSESDRPVPPRADIDPFVAAPPFDHSPSTRVHNVVKDVEQSVVESVGLAHLRWKELQNNSGKRAENATYWKSVHPASY